MVFCLLEGNGGLLHISYEFLSACFILAGFFCMCLSVDIGTIVCSHVVSY